LEISPEKIKYKRISKRKKTFSSNYKKNFSKLTESIFPLPWAIWPYEAKILIVIIGIWSILGICILGSSSWWVASREMGNWAYFLKKQSFGQFQELVYFISFLIQTLEIF